jgi:hypothetical protein
VFLIPETLRPFRSTPKSAEFKKHDLIAARFNSPLVWALMKSPQSEKLCLWFPAGFNPESEIFNLQSLATCHCPLRYSSLFLIPALRSAPPAHWTLAQRRNNLTKAGGIGLPSLKTEAIQCPQSKILRAHTEFYFIVSITMSDRL